MKSGYSLVFLGLSITSSWGNGHATTYRALLRALSRLGHRCVFLERDMPWYAENRDELRSADYDVYLYRSLQELKSRFAFEVSRADAVIVGSYVPEGVAVSRWVARRAGGVIAFYDIDTPVTLRKLACGDEEYISAADMRRFDLYLSFTGGKTLELIERKFGVKRAAPLYCSVDPERYRPLDQLPERALGYLGTYSEDRQPALDRLLLEPARRHPEWQFTVAGPCYPEWIAWPPNVHRTDHIAPRDHSAFYRSQRFTLNVTRAEMIQMGFSPSVRLFEAAACATPVISDRWPGIQEFFAPGRELLLADTTRQVEEYLCDIPDAERRAIGQRARERVLASHTAVHRAEQLLAYLRETQKFSAAAHPSAAANDQSSDSARRGEHGHRAEAVPAINE